MWSGQNELLFLLPNFSMDVFLPSPLSPSRLSSPGRGAAESQRLASVGMQHSPASDASCSQSQHAAACGGREPADNEGMTVRGREERRKGGVVFNRG